MQSKSKLMIAILFVTIAMGAHSLDITFLKFQGDEAQQNRLASEHQRLYSAGGKKIHVKHPLSEFYSLVTIGHQSLPILFSTTADMDFIVGKSCMNCAFTEKPFDASQEPAFMQSTEILTTDEGGVKGKVSMCSFSMGGQNGGQTEFILADSVKYPLQHSGVLSLSPKSTSFLSQMNEKGFINQKIFSLKYSEAHPQLHFGVSEEELKAYDYYQLFNPQTWSIELDDISFGSQSLSQSPSHAIFDTSTDLLILPEYTAINVLSALSENGWECQHDKSEKHSSLTCDKNLNAKPFKITLRFDGNSYHIPSSSLMGQCTRSGNTDDQHCTTLISFCSKVESAVLGQSILQNFETIFDAEEGRIGLAEVSTEDGVTNRTVRGNIKGILYWFALGVLFLGSMLAVVWIAQKLILKKGKEHRFENEIRGGGVELAQV